MLSVVVVLDVVVEVVVEVVVVEVLVVLVVVEDISGQRGRRKPGAN